MLYRYMYRYGSSILRFIHSLESMHASTRGVANQNKAEVEVMLLVFDD